MKSARPKRVLMLATNGFAELVESRQALREAGLHVTLAALSRDPIEGVVYDTETRGMSRTKVTPDASLRELEVGEYDALVLPGGVASPDTLRMSHEAVDVVRSFVATDRWVAAICHAPWLLVEADAVAGRRVTGWHSIRTDLRNAGGHVMDAEVVQDGRLLTSRMPSDIPAFVRAIVEVLGDTANAG